MEPAPITIEELLAHAGWVRKLAGSLVRDAGTADDVAQEVWAYALRSPPRDRRNLRAWLSAAVRSTARSISRSESRRSQREAVAARIDADPTPDELVERGQLLRVLVEQVLALDEPHRSLVLAHWFEGQSLAEIARRERRGVRSVKASLDAAHAHLRSRMDDTAGGRETWMLGFLKWADRSPIGVHASGPGTTIALGGLALVTKYVLAGGALVLVGFLGWVLWPHVERSASISEPADVARATTAASGGQSTLSSSAVETASRDGRPADQQHVPSPGASVGAPSPAAQASGQLPSECLVTVEVEDPDGHMQPKGASRVWGRSAEAPQQDLGETIRKFPGATGFHRYEIPPGRYTFGAESPEFGHTESTVDVKLAHPPEVELKFKPVQTITAFLNIADSGTSQEEPSDVRMFVPYISHLWAHGEGWASGASGWDFRLRLGVGALLWRHVSDHEPLEAPPAGSIRELVGTLEVYGTPLPQVDFWLGHSLWATRETRSGTNDIVFDLTRRDLVASLSTLKVSCTDAVTHKPLACDLALVYDDGIGSQGMGLGNWPGAVHEFRWIGPGEATVSIASSGHATRWFRSTFLPGETTDLGDVPLVAERSVRGIVDGLSSDQWPVYLSARNIGDSAVEGEVEPRVAIRDDNTFEIPGLSDSTYLLAISGPYQGKPIVVRTAGAVAPIHLQAGPSSSVFLSTRPSDERFMTVEIQDKDGHPVHSVKLGPTSRDHGNWFRLEYGSYDFVCRSGTTELGTRSVLVDRPKLEVVIE